MAFDGGDAHLTRAALRCLYGAAGAHLRADTADVALLVGQAVAEVPLGELLDVGALSVAEQLRDVAGWRRLSATGLVRVLLDAHTELSRGRNLATLVLSGARSYLEGAEHLWDPEELCALAACPTAAVETVVTVLAAAIAWRARDADVVPAQLVTSICLGLATREAGVPQP